MVARKGKLPVSCAMRCTEIRLCPISRLGVGRRCKASGVHRVILQVRVLLINRSILERISFQGGEVSSFAGSRAE